jgi:5-methylcytosine-specific restriction endonuclease McrA
MAKCLIKPELSLFMFRSASDFFNPMRKLDTCRPNRVEWLPLISHSCVKRNISTEVTLPRTKRIKFSSYLKRSVASSQQWRCSMCNELLPACYEIDHKQALWAGGTNEESNLQALCRNCHGTKTLKENDERWQT